jgi:hypothetical protein
MNYTVIENVLTEQELEAVNRVVLGYDYPWFYHPSDTHDSQGLPFMCHTLMHRHDSYTPVEGNVNSESYQFFKSIFDRLCPEKTVLRASLNLTFHNPAQHGSIHLDHEFEHHNLIIYLSHTSAGTLLFDENHKQIDRIPSDYNTAAIFQGQHHAQELCAPGETRLVAVFTYID